MKKKISFLFIKITTSLPVLRQLYKQLKNTKLVLGNNKKKYQKLHIRLLAINCFSQI